MSNRYKVPMVPDVLVTPLRDDEVAKIIYQTLYGNNPAMPTWDDVFYHAPETTAGYAARLIQIAADNLRKAALVK